MSNMKIRAIEESNAGVYLWMRDNGQLISDENGNYLSMPSIKGDEYKLGIFRKRAHEELRNAGVEPDGKPVFLSGHRQVSENEYEKQRQRQLMGLTPDLFDVGAAQGELEYAKRFGKQDEH
jgi:hypothetical protein